MHIVQKIQILHILAHLTSFPATRVYSYCTSFGFLLRTWFCLQVKHNRQLLKSMLHNFSAKGGTCFFSVGKFCKGGGWTPLIRHFFCVLPHGVIPDIAAIAVKLKCRRKWGVNQQIVVQTSADPANWFNQALSGLTLESECCFHFKPCTLFNWPSCQVQL